MAKRADPGPSHRDRLLERGDGSYPASLLDLPDPPERVHVRGAWPLAPVAVGIVGSRAATPYGLAFAERLAADLAALGIVVVSGLAQGIDAAAHRGAMRAGGTTCAVLPGGLEPIVPPGHAGLAAEIAGHGTLMTEREPGAATYPSSFLERNRLIAALAQAVVVVEAALKSGALNTASHARRLGRPVLAVPGDVGRATSRGTHGLLRGGALLCEGAADVRAALGAGGAKTPARRGPEVADDTNVTEKLLRRVSARAATVEDCARAAGLGLSETLERLLRLEWAGLVRRDAGGRWGSAS